MVEKIKVNRFWKNIIEFVKENGYFFLGKKGKFDKKKLCFSCGNDKFSVTFIFSTIFKPKEIDFGKISLNLSKKMVIFLGKKGKFDKKKLCFSCGNDKFIVTFIFSTTFKQK